MNIKLKDGSIREFASGLTVKDILFEISPGLGRAAAAAILDGEVVDLRTVVGNDAELTALTVITSYSIHYTKLYDYNCAQVNNLAVKNSCRCSAA